MDNPLLQPYPGLMIWTLITFFLAMFVLKKYAFGPIQEAIDKRRQMITQMVDDAERTNARSQELLAQYTQQLADARKESEQIVERARKAGDELTQRVKSEANEQRQRAIADTRQQVHVEIEKAMGEIKATVAEMTLVAAEKVIGRTLDVETHEKLVEDAIEELDFAELQKVGA